MNTDNSSAYRDQEIDITELVFSLWHSKHLIGLVTLVFALLGVVYVSLATPMYEADALIQIEEKPNTGTALSGEMAELFNSVTSAITETEILRSRMVIGKTVDDLNLTTVAEPAFFPIFGKGLHRLFGQPRSLVVSLFSPNPDQPRDMLTLVSTGGSTYELHNSEGKKILSGIVGRTEQNQGITLTVDSLDAKKGDRFRLYRIDKGNVINAIRERLQISEKGKQSGILQLRYTHESPDEAEDILDSITLNYQEQNILREAAEAEKSLGFLNQRLPEMRSKLELAEAELNKYKQSRESVDLNQEAQTLLEIMVNLESQLNELTLKESELAQRFTKAHPVYIALLNNKQALLAEREQLSGSIRKLPETQQEIIKLSRDWEVNKEVFAQLLNRTQEIRVMKAGIIGFVRIIDSARGNPQAVSPVKSRTLMMFTFLGIILGIGLSLIRSFWQKNAISPEEIEQLGLSVMANIPFSKKEVLLNKSSHKTQHVHERLLSLAQPKDISTEALRSLRTSLHFSMMSARNNVVMISSPSPGNGKSFISSNLAAIMASAGKKVLLIDADLRRGSIARQLKASSPTGLSGYLSGQCALDDTIIHLPIEGLDFIARGAVPENPAELLINARFEALIHRVQQEYDIVLIDTPPVLAVTDPQLIAKHAGTVIMVGRFGLNSLKEVQSAVRKFEQSGTMPAGFVMNATLQKQGQYYHNKYGYYSYSYR
jgi:tyrosine-protein kinase Etk/Wzc